MAEPIFAPRDIFEQILQYAVIPTFDLIIELPEGGIVILYRSIAPYQNKWSLPGLRMYKNETMNDTMIRIAKQELSLEIDAKSKKLIGQYVGKFSTEFNRQDLSSGYVVRALSDNIKLNEAHFTKFKIIKNKNEVPEPIGAMYKFYINQYFDR
jgi:ADP-ribose pyrophosphatase YjhB (NUDIX family)